MDNQILKKTARALLRSSEYSFVLSIGKKGKLSTFSISIKPEEITHITGLDHIPSIKRFTDHKNNLKKQVIKKISDGDKLLSEFKQEDIDILNSPIDKTYNPQTQNCYTLMDRIKKLKNINVFLSRAYKGKLYNWKKPLLPIKTPDNKYRNVNIEADYMLVIPSNTPKENIYLFMYVDKFNKEPITKLNVFSIFQDGVDLTQSQILLGTILKEEKINNKTHQSSILIDNTTKHAPTSVPNEQLSKRDDQLFNALEENKKNKLLLSEKDDLLSEKDKQLADSAKVIASLKEENSKLSEKIEALENPKQTVLTAARSKGSFGENLSSFADRIHSENAAKSQQQSKPNLKPTDKPKR